MKGRTAAEKILAKASGRPLVTAGEVVEASPGLVMSHENSYLVDKAFREFKLGRPVDPDRIVIVLDHRTPANTAQTASVHAAIR
ncbi:MAG: 3-isopropylmalate dehydratase large subunit, partial [Thermoplasmata archaeon]|nr:3-isopropylmalate dehydratase large subunit [Thermoplasmata archaeon]